VFVTSVPQARPAPIRSVCSRGKPRLKTLVRVWPGNRGDGCARQPVRSRPLSGRACAHRVPRRDPFDARQPRTKAAEFIVPMCAPGLHRNGKFYDFFYKTRTLMSFRGPRSVTMGTAFSGIFNVIPAKRRTSKHRCQRLLDHPPSRHRRIRPTVGGDDRYLWSRRCGPPAHARPRIDSRTSPLFTGSQAGKPQQRCGGGRMP